MPTWLAIIRKDGPGRSGTSRTYTLRYTIRQTETRTLFQEILRASRA